MARRHPLVGGAVYVEDARGNRIVDGRAELGFAMAVAVPAGEQLFVRNNDREAALFLRAGDRQPFDRLDFHRRPMRSRGAMESSLQAGLFVMPFGPAYYSGYTDRQEIGGGQRSAANRGAHGAAIGGRVRARVDRRAVVASRRCGSPAGVVRDLWRAGGERACRFPGHQHRTRGRRRQRSLQAGYWPGADVPDLRRSLCRRLVFRWTTSMISRRPWLGCRRCCSPLVRFTIPSRIGATPQAIASRGVSVSMDSAQPLATAWPAARAPPAAARGWVAAAQGWAVAAAQGWAVAARPERVVARERAAVAQPGRGGARGPAVARGLAPPPEAPVRLGGRAAAWPAPAPTSTVAGMEKALTQLKRLTPAMTGPVVAAPAGAPVRAGLTAACQRTRTPGRTRPRPTAHAAPGPRCRQACAPRPRSRCAENSAALLAANRRSVAGGCGGTARAAPRLTSHIGFTIPRRSSLPRTVTPFASPPKRGQRHRQPPIFEPCGPCLGRFVTIVPGDGDGIVDPVALEQVVPMPVPAGPQASLPLHRIAHQWGHVVGLDDAYKRADRDPYVSFDPAVCVARWAARNTRPLRRRSDRQAGRTGISERYVRRVR